MTSSRSVSPLSTVPTSEGRPVPDRRRNADRKPLRSVPSRSAALEAADVIACEDTRRTGRLLQLSGLPKRRLLVANEHTEVSVAAEVIDCLDKGLVVALVSDAGMPGVSDPGQRLIAAVIAAGFEIEVIPGPTAMTTALVASGLVGDRFVFEGFLARKGRERTTQLEDIAVEKRTTVIYESPKRLQRTVGDLRRWCGDDRPVAVARELTKMHEEVVRGTLGSVSVALADVEPRGEYVVVVAGAPAETQALSDDGLVSLLDEQLAKGLSRRDTVVKVVADTGAPKRRVYTLANRLS